MDRCPECGFVYEQLPREAISDAIRALGATYFRRLSDHDPSRLRAHPIPATWSPLEYACHVRDVLGIQRERVELVRVEDEPSFTPMGREERVVADRYNDQNPGIVAQNLDRAAGALAETLETLREPEWQRTGIYNWPTRQPRSIDWIARHTIHEGRHHLCDLDRLLSTTV